MKTENEVEVSREEYMPDMNDKDIVSEISKILHEQQALLYNRLEVPVAGGTGSGGKYNTVSIFLERLSELHSAISALTKDDPSESE
jgi:hypothetical protein